MLRRGTSAFQGGIHPTDGYDKSLSMEQAVKPYHPKTVTILSEQSSGGKCELLVQPGDSVNKGQLIGKPAAFNAAPLHASVSGTVLEIKDISAQGREIPACIIERRITAPSDKSETVGYRTQAADIRSITPEKILNGLRNGGLVGMGGAGFPTHRKYETDKIIDTLLINGAECEPFLTCDYRLMLEDGFALLNGVRLLLKVSGAGQAYICLEDNKPKAAEHLTNILKTAKDSGMIKETENITIKVLPTRYPQGGERQLIQAVLSREVPVGGLPADVGVIVSNVGTTKAAADMVLGGLPLTERIVTVTGWIKQPGNYLVPIGTSAKELLGLCGGVTTQKNRIIAGGPMTGSCIASDWNGREELFYVTKTTSGILVLPDSEYREQPCIRCQGCANICPAGLTPYQIEIALLNEDYDLCEKLYASECIACGGCSYICPAKRELTMRTRMAKEIVKQRMYERTVKNS